jgi:hypothetical protein
MSGSDDQTLDLLIVRHIAQRYGNVIDLDKSPGVLAEIMRVYGGRFPTSGGNFSTMVQGGQGTSVGQDTA